MGMGPLGSEPAAGVDGQNRRYVFWKGTDDNLWEAFWDGKQWNGPVGIGMGPLGSPPGVAVAAGGEQYVFWKGTDDNLWEAFWDGKQWNGPTGLDELPPPKTCSFHKDLGQMAGWVQVDITSTGSITYSGHIHNDAAIAEAFEFGIRCIAGKINRFLSSILGKSGAQGPMQSSATVIGAKPRFDPKFPVTLRI